LKQGLKTAEYRVVLNGANRSIFHSEGYKRWDRSRKIKIVTHHWGGGYFKGFDIYERLDRMLTEASYNEKVEFAYIGNLPEGFRFRNANWVPPQSGVKLAASIRSHHVYLTASQNEPAGMHHIEGALCGLPLLYRESGALPEYCDGFGISFTTDNFEYKFQEMLTTYEFWADQMKDYSHTAERMCDEYYDLFQDMLGRRQEIMKRRKWRYRPTWLARVLFR
jgi:hypothetical protein